MFADEGSKEPQESKNRRGGLLLLAMAVPVSIGMLIMISVGFKQDHAQVALLAGVGLILGLVLIGIGVNTWRHGFRASGQIVD